MHHDQEMFIPGMEGCVNIHKSINLSHYINKLKVAQSCPTLCDPMDYRVQGILQARILEWVACPFSRESSQPRG